MPIYKLVHIGTPYIFLMNLSESLSFIELAWLDFQETTLSIGNVFTSSSLKNR